MSQLTYAEIIDLLELKDVPWKRTGFPLKPGVQEVANLNEILNYILTHNVKVTITVDENRLKFNLNIIKTLIFAKRSFFYTILGFFQSFSRELGEIDGFIQMIPGTYKSDKHINITGIDNVHLKSDYIQGSIVNGCREPILYSFALDKPLGHKIYKEPRIKLFEKLDKSVLSHITFHLEDDDHKPVDFDG